MRDGHVRVLPLHVANKIAAGEVVERPASVVKELVENAIDAGSTAIKISITQGGRKLVSVQDDGCGMTRDDAVLSLERQATSKISDVDDIEKIDTLGFRGEAIPSIASVSRFSITTRRHESDEGTFLQVNAGTLAEVRSAGCPPGTLVEVRDLFCNVPARRKFLRAYTTEENHVRQIFTVHALAHPSIAFTLVVDGREVFRLASATKTEDRVRDIFGKEFVESLLPITEADDKAKTSVKGFIERPNLFNPTRREQYIFINGRPATAPSIAYALREAYPRRPGDVKPAAILFITLPPTEVDVNVHPTKREVRFRDNVAVKHAVIEAIERALMIKAAPAPIPVAPAPTVPTPRPIEVAPAPVKVAPAPIPVAPALIVREIPAPAPIQTTLSLSSDGRTLKPWKWFNYLAQTATGYLIIETDEGIVTINPVAAQERLAYERLLASSSESSISQALLIPETVQLSPADFARLEGSLEIVRAMGFQLEPFGANVFKVDAMPQMLGKVSPAALLSTIAHDLSEPGAKRGDKWREELIAKSISKTYAGASTKLTSEGAIKLVEELSVARMPYISPRGKPVMNFMSNRELARKFDRD